MQEDFLHYIWGHKKFSIAGLRTTAAKLVNIHSVGTLNSNAGPDFFNAKINIDDQLWAGNVEIHIKSSDWYLHDHQNDKNYDNVILHVVWEHDTEIFRKDNSIIPTLELKSYVLPNAIKNYSKLFSSSGNWINCEKDFPNVDDFTIGNWLERLYFERLEQKATIIFQQLETLNQDWEAVLFKMLAKNFGLKVNADAFFSMASSFDFSVLRKSQSKIEHLEALLFGQAGLLEDNMEAPYYNSIKTEYHFLRNKFALSNALVITPSFFRLRPSNFPTIRLSQLANLYHKHKNLVSNVLEAKSIEAIYKLFTVGVSGFWKQHYTFSKASKPSTKIISKTFIDLLIINTIIPLKFCYAKSVGKSAVNEILNIIEAISPEKNNIVEKFNTLNPVTKHALHSQALLQLKNEYCNTHRCLKCAIGHKLLTQ